MIEPGDTNCLTTFWAWQSLEPQSERFIVAGPTPIFFIACEIVSPDVFSMNFVLSNTKIGWIVATGD